MTTKMIDAEPAEGSAQPDLSVVAEQLVATGRTQGVELTGPGGLLTGLTRQVLETALETELGEHLGHERGERSGSGNVRNGSSAKTLRTDVGEVRIRVPRDWEGTFAPTVAPRHTRRLAGFDDAVLSLYAKGMTTGDIANHLPSGRRWSSITRDVERRPSFGAALSGVALPALPRATDQ
jgi:putative transposase